MTSSTLSKISAVVQNLNGRAFNRSAKATRSHLALTLWSETQRWLLMIIGITIAALGYSLFQIPHDIAAGGITGIAIIVNHFVGWSVGTMYLLMNIPLLVLGYYQLGGWAFVWRTTIAVIIFSVVTDVFTVYLPQWLPDYPLTDDLLLNTVYAGLIGGVGGGFCLPSR